MAYFTPWNSSKIYSYQADGDVWDRLPDCPHCEPGLAVIKGMLTTFGGKEGSDYTGNLYSWTDGKWMRKFPPMAVKRARPAVVTTSNDAHVIAAGGWVNGWTMVVELYRTQDEQWSRVCSLPQPLVAPDATFCDNRMYVQDSGHSVFACFTESLAFSGKLDTDEQDEVSEPVWSPIRDIPVESSTLVTLCNQLVAVGGCTKSATTEILHYNSRKRWEVIGQMMTPRYDCLVPVLTGDTMVVVAGWVGEGESTDAVEVASVL